MLISLIIPLCIIFTIAILTLVERKVLAGVQRRVGPLVVGYRGILQPFADALKLLLKEIIIPSLSNIKIFIGAPVLIFIISLINYSIIPINKGSVLISEINLGFLFILAISSLGVYSIIMAGWASNNKYAFLGSLRSAAQVISYEVSLGLIILIVILGVGSLNLITIIEAQKGVWNIYTYFPFFILFLVSALAETNRTPFDLPEAESELVSGYNVEYSSFTFALFFLAEYANIILMCYIIVIFFIGGFLPFIFLDILSEELTLIIKVLLIIYLFLIIRGTLPRYRFDQLMVIGWKVILPLTIGYIYLMINIYIYY